MSKKLLVACEESQRVCAAFRTSVTFEGIAKAMANQWGDLDKQMCKLA